MIRIKSVSHLLLIALLFISSSTVFATISNDNKEVAADKDPVLFTFGDSEVKKSEFVYVYEKHNSQDSNQYSRQSVEEYLDLYVNFKLKVREAESLGMDTNKAIISQLGEYRKQLSKSYLYDKKVSDNLIKEAYERMKEEVKTSHILFMVGADAAPTDTLKTYNNAVATRKKIIAGENFEVLARKNSQDPSVKDNGGDLGYITAFQTVYPFESATYKTKVGEVSEPIRTKFGYHLIKVDDKRPARGEVQVAHILIASSKKDDKAKKEIAKKKIEAIYQQLKAGEKFDELARKLSNDRKSAKKGGTLPAFTSGKMLPEFEEVSFKLNKAEEFSSPFRTSIGWHIVKLLKKESIGTFEETQSKIKKKIDRDGRASVSKKVFLKRLKKEYDFQENLANKKWFFEKINTSQLQKGRWKSVSLKALNLEEKPLASLTIPKGKEQKYSLLDFATFAEANQRQGNSKNGKATLDRLYDMYVEQVLIEVEESRLEEKHLDFAKLMKEFRDGTLLFELTEKRIWNKALADTTGLNAFFEKNKSDYQWDERLDATIFTFDPSVDVSKKVRKYVCKKKIDKLKKMIGHSTKMPKVAIRKSTYEKDQNAIVKQIDWKKGTSKIVENEDGHKSIVNIHEVLPTRQKALKDARGFVVADYQTDLEKQWITELKEKYPIRINQSVLKKIHKYE